jgi:hypothetical protein
VPTAGAGHLGGSTDDCTVADGLHQVVGRGRQRGGRREDVGPRIRYADVWATTTFAARSPPAGASSGIFGNTSEGCGEDFCHESTEPGEQTQSRRGVWVRVRGGGVRWARRLEERPERGRDFQSEESGTWVGCWR